MIHAIERATGNAASRSAYGTIHVCNVDVTGREALSQWLARNSGISLGAMGTRAKQRASDEGLPLDFSYGVIDKCILSALNGKSSLILTVGGMVQRVERRVADFTRESGAGIRVGKVGEE
jgi:cobalt/nickel transport system ATP-binding protein